MTRAVPIALVLLAGACSSPKPSDSGTTGTATGAGTPAGTATGSGTNSGTNGSPTAPDAEDDGYDVVEGNDVNLSMLDNDSDPDGDALDPATLTVVQAPLHGSLQFLPDGRGRYTHDASEESEDTFTYTIADDTGEVSNIAVVTLTVVPVNDPPEATDDTGAVVDEGGLVVIDVAANDLDVDDGLDLTSIVITQAPAHGTATPNFDGTITYQHDGTEPVDDIFGYQIADQAGANSGGARVEVAVNPVNDPPTARNDLAGVIPGGVVNIRASLNDLDPDDGLDLTTLVIVSNPAHGTLVANADGTFDFTHDGGLDTEDTFTYTIEDQSGAVSNVATVDIVIGDAVCNPGQQQVFGATGAEEIFVAPCTGLFTLEAWGAQGEGGNGGLGGYASGQTMLVIGQVLYLNVGGQDGYNGGGPGWAISAHNGGGASDVRLDNNLLIDRILVAGGGGGSSGDANYQGGSGGGGVCGVNYCGGGGADGYGGAGGDGGLDGGIGNVSCHAGGAGGGGFQTGGEPSCNTCYTNTCGMDGALGLGGAGDTWENGICYDYYGGTSGGGGGYFGGGGSSVGNCGSGGGGGGSSYTGTLTSPVMTGGVRVGSGEVVISW